jgi:glycosyltransferase involved in cell wall biosynthesis
MKKLKVLMVGLLPPDIEKVDGGVVAVMLNLLAGFSRMENLEVMMVSFNQDVNESKTIIFSSNVKIQYIPYVSKFKLIDYFINRKNFKELVVSFQPDIIHVQEVTPHILRFIHLPKDFIVVTQHGIMSEEFKYAVGIKDKLQCLFKGFIERKFFPLFKNIIFISDYNRNLFSGKNFFDQKIYNPVSPIFFKAPITSGKLNSIMYVGRLNKNKNLSIVLQALGKLKRENILFDLHVVGGYKDDYYETVVNSLMAEYELKDQVTFYGWQTQEQILSLYEKCRIFVLPSQQETMPVAIAEAMAQGKVVVASNVGAISEMLTDQSSGFLFERNNLEQLCDRLRLLYNNKELIEKISFNALKEATEKFHPDTIASKTVDFYLKVLERGIQKSKPMANTHE